MTAIRSVVVISYCAFVLSCGDVTADVITRKPSARNETGGVPSPDTGCDGPCAGNGAGGTSERPACTTDAQCGDPTPRCDVASGICVACLDSDDCRPPAECGARCDFDAVLCHPTRHRCVECVTDGHCDDPWEQCSAALGLCATSCQTSTDCVFDERICDEIVGFCVECQVDDDCLPGDACRNATCI